MTPLTSLSDLAARGARVSLAAGFFDGVHRGHRCVLSAAVARARAFGGEAWALTFDPHPLAVLDPEHAPALLTPPALRDDLLAACGIDGIVVLPFTREFASLSPREFIQRHLLHGDWAPEVVFAGDDWRFGAGGAGTLADVPAFSDGRIRVRTVPELLDAGEPVSSTRIRAALADGDLPLARRLLGHPVFLRGTVAHGRAVGRTLFAATANLVVCGEETLPVSRFPLPVTRFPFPVPFRHGVYAAWLSPQTGNGQRVTGNDHGPRQRAVVNIGFRPTFHDDDSGTLSIEAHLLDFSGDLYGRTLTLELTEFLRDEQAFESPEALAEQIRRDVETARMAGRAEPARLNLAAKGRNAGALLEPCTEHGVRATTPQGLREAENGKRATGNGKRLPILHPEADTPALRAWLDSPAFEEALQGRGPEAKILQDGRNRTVLVQRVPDVGDVVVKKFGAQSAFKDWIARHGKGSKALRAYRASAYLHDRGIATPAPLAVLERWEGNRLRESVLVTRAVPGLRSFRRELVDLYAAHGPCGVLMDRLEQVAEFCADMHDAGFFHRDLGNQNLFFAPASSNGRRETGNGKRETILTLDLNRGRCLCRPLTLAKRARDLSRINLPSDLLRVFLEMYWRGDVPPQAFLRAERRERRRYALHTATRSLRHPFRKPRPPSPDGEYPADRDFWIWDERSVQAISVFRRHDRHRLQQPGRVTKTIVAVLSALCLHGLRGRFRRYRTEAFAHPVDTVGERLTIALTARPDTLDGEIALLRELGARNTLLRLYAHESREAQNFALEAARRLHAEGFGVSLALVQCRDSVTDSAGWDALGRRALAAVAPFVRWVEVAHAVNRVKWGLWGYRDLRTLFAPLAGWRRDFPNVRFTGPSVIDFEPDFTATALRVLRQDVKGPVFNALSQHLYVDRRGAPEREQNGYDAVGKLALLRAIADASGVVGNGGLVVSEFNWPLVGQGVYSPVGSPYVSPGVRHGDPSVSEEAAAAYTVRYLLLGLCSGLASEMVFWRLQAQGFGLTSSPVCQLTRLPVDQFSGSPVRRPAFVALKTWFRELSGARFVAREDEADGSRITLRFEKESGEPFAVSWNPTSDEMPVLSKMEAPKSTKRG